MPAKRSSVSSGTPTPKRVKRHAHGPPPAATLAFDHQAGVVADAGVWRRSEEPGTPLSVAQTPQQVPRYRGLGKAIAEPLTAVHPSPSPRRSTPATPTRRRERPLPKPPAAVVYVTCTAGTVDEDVVVAFPESMEDVGTPAAQPRRGRPRKRGPPLVAAAQLRAALRGVLAYIRELPDTSARGAPESVAHMTRQAADPRWVGAEGEWGCRIEVPCVEGVANDELRQVVEYYVGELLPVAVGHVAEMEAEEQQGAGEEEEEKGEEEREGDDEVAGTSAPCIEQVNQQHAAELTACREAHAAEVQRLQAQHATERTAVAELSQQLQAAHAAQRSEDDAAQRVDTLTAELAACRTQHAAELAACREQHAAELEGLQAQLQQLQVTHDSVRLTSQDAAQRVDALTAELAACRTQHAAELAVCSEAHAAEVQRLQAQHAADRTAVTELSQQLQAAHAAARSEDDAAQRVTALASELAACREQHAAELEGLQAQLQQLQVTHDSRRLTSQDAVQRVDALTAELAACRTQHAAELAVCSEAHAAEVQRLQAQHAAETRAVQPQPQALHKAQGTKKRRSPAPVPLGLCGTRYPSGARLRAEPSENSKFLIDSRTRKYILVHAGAALHPAAHAAHGGFTRVRDRERGLAGWLRTDALVELEPVHTADLQSKRATTSALPPPSPRRAPEHAATIGTGTDNEAPLPTAPAPALPPTHNAVPSSNNADGFETPEGLTPSEDDDKASPDVDAAIGAPTQ